MPEWIVKANSVREIKEGICYGISAKQLIRCGECKWNGDMVNCGMAYEADDHFENHSWNSSNDYCSYGEHR